jgi:predicted amidohydrolase YtcJ
VKVVGEFEIGNPNPETYYDILDVYVNREMEIGVGTEATAPEKYGDGEVFVPEEGIDRVVALKLFTYRSAEFLYAETKIGSLEVGKLADFVVTDKPYLSGPDREIRDNKTILTVLAGERRYQDPDYNPVIR